MLICAYLEVLSTKMVDMDKRGRCNRSAGTSGQGDFLTWGQRIYRGHDHMRFILQLEEPRALLYTSSRPSPVYRMQS